MNCNQCEFYTVVDNPEGHERWECAITKCPLIIRAEERRKVLMKAAYLIETKKGHFASDLACADMAQEIRAIR